MVNSASTQAIQRFVTLLQGEWAKLDAKHQAALDTEDVLDIFWLAHHIQPDVQVIREAQATPSVVTEQKQKLVAPPQEREPSVAVYTPPPATESPVEQTPGVGAGLPLQVPAANALRSQRELERSLRPLKRKIPSPTQCWLDEEATAVQIAEQGVWSPVLVRAPERCFDLAIVVEDSPSLKLWEDTITELQALVERLGAFRQIRTWSLQGQAGGAIRVRPNWQPTSTQVRSRPASALLDPLGRRLIWLVSDCTSDLWDYPAIYCELEQWGKWSPLAIVQLLPERLWARTALGIGRPMRLHAGSLGASLERLSKGATGVYPGEEEAGVRGQESGGRGQEAGGRGQGAGGRGQEAGGRGQEAGGRRQEAGGRRQEAGDRRQETGGRRAAEFSRGMILPTIPLEPEPVSRWATVTAGVGDASVVGLQLFLHQLQPQSGLPALSNPLTPEQRVQQFCATASITAQKLAGLMAAVPVSLPVVHLIQKTLLPQSLQVHVAEVFMGGLLDAVAPPPDRPQQPPHYRFPEPVREKLIDAVPISKTTQVLDTVSAYISERLGLGTKSFTTLIASLPELEPDQQQAVQPFAELTLSTLRRLGGDYRAKADQLARSITPSPPTDTTSAFPPLQEHRYQTAWLEVEPLQRFDFETATIERQVQSRQKRRKSSSQRVEWIITKSPGYGWQRVEDLGGGVQLELVEILGGRFLMGSPEDEPERFDSEGPQHEVTLGDFFIGKYPVTQAQWRAVAALPQVNLELRPDPSHFKGENRPVERVSWHEAVEFCARLSLKTGREYRLPTEAEWEYACRSGTTTPFHFGEMLTTELANYDGDYTYSDGPKGVNRGTTTPVGSFPANGWGVYDLHGNVWEWCADYWHGDYADKPEALKQDGHKAWLLAETQARRSLRGGSWLNDPGLCRSAIRSYNRPDVRYDTVGFRVVCGAARTP